MLEPAQGKIVIKDYMSKGKDMAGNIYIPEAARVKSEMYVVIAIGSGGKDGNGDAFFYPEVGAVVITAQYGGVSVKYKDIEYRIISYLDVLATVPPAEVEEVN